MSSCEVNRCSSYSDDLRWRMVWQRLSLQRTYQQIGVNLNVDPSTVQRTVELFEQTGSVSKRPYPSGRVPKKLSYVVELIILNKVLTNPATKLNEIKVELHETYGVDLCESTICEYLCKMGFSHKKLSFVAEQQDHLLRAKFISDVSVFQPNMFIFLDETGTDRRDALRRYGYSLRGKRARQQTLLMRGKHISVLSIMSTEGLLDSKVFHQNIDGDCVYDFTISCLLPHLQPYNGRNPHCVVILDNASIHHVSEISTAIQDMGALILFLPPYSPDMNPIEELFAKVKAMMKMQTEYEDIDVIALSAFAQVTQQDCRNWIAHAEIYGQP